MIQGLDLLARLESSAATVTAGGTTYTYRHPTKEQIAAAMSLAGVDPSALSAAAEAEEVTPDTLAYSARMQRAYELLGALCVEDVSPRPVPADTDLRARNSLGLLQLSETALRVLDPAIAKIGEYLFEQSNLGEEEGKR